MRSYFLTHGRGASEFVLNELKKLLAKTDSICDDSVEGKIVFSTDLPIDRLIELKTVERLFLCLVFINFSHSGSKVDTSELIERSLGTLDKDLFESNEFNFILRSYRFNRDLVDDTSKRVCLSKKFRLNCKLTGSYRKLEWIKSYLKDKLLAKLNLIDGKFELDANEPDFELVFHLTDACLAFGIQITRQPLSNRSYIKHVGLRSTICSMMLQMSSLANESIVLDPFCGKSTIFAEYFGSSSSQMRHFFIGSDSSHEQLDLSIDNNTNVSSCDFVRSALIHSLAFRSQSIDVIISDLPFGKNHARQFYDDSVERFYSEALIQFERVLCKPNGYAVLLVNSNEITLFENAIECLEKTKDAYHFKIVKKQTLSLGETSAALYRLNLALIK